MRFETPNIMAHSSGAMFQRARRHGLQVPRSRKGSEGPDTLYWRVGAFLFMTTAIAPSGPIVQTALQSELH